MELLTCRMNKVDAVIDSHLQVSLYRVTIDVVPTIDRKLSDQRSHWQFSEEESVKKFWPCLPDTQRVERRKTTILFFHQLSALASLQWPMTMPRMMQEWILCHKTQSKALNQVCNFQTPNNGKSSSLQNKKSTWRIRIYVSWNLLLECFIKHDMAM